MWLTADVLRRVQVLDAPDGLRHVIEHVYGPEPELRVPSGLAEALLDIRAVYGKERGIAHGNTLRVIDGYARTGPWDRDDRVPTRLGEDTVTIRLAVIREGQVHPWARRRSDETSISRLWSLSELRVRRHYLSSDAVPAGFDAAVATAKSTWTNWQRNDVRMLVVNADGSTPTNLLYCPRLGLRRTP